MKIDTIMAMSKNHVFEFEDRLEDQSVEGFEIYGSSAKDSVFMLLKHVDDDCSLWLIRSNMVDEVKLGGTRYRIAPEQALVLKVVEEKEDK